MRHLSAQICYLLKVNYRYLGYWMCKFLMCCFCSTLCLKKDSSQQIQMVSSCLLYDMHMTHTHTPPFNGLFSRTTWVGRYEKDKPFWILLKQERMGWQWHQLNHMQIIYTSLQTDNHASTLSLHIFTGWMPFLPANQQRQSTEGKTICIQISVIFHMLSNML